MCVLTIRRCCSVFFIIQLLAALSPIIDVIRGYPSSFGTQHVALVLAAWGPFVIFGMLFIHVLER